jgi:hypothetical protein
MKKNNPYFADDEIDFIYFIKIFWRERILILPICIICSFLGYLYATYESKVFKTQVTLKNPPLQLFEPYSLESYKITINNNNINNSTSAASNYDNKNNSDYNFSINYNYNYNSSNITEQFITDFKLNFLSTDFLVRFFEESKEFDNFKRYLNSKNITANKYFSSNKISEFNEKNITNKNAAHKNTYLFFFTEELEGDIFLNNYVEFVRKKTILEFKEKLKLTIENKLTNFAQALEINKLINLEKKNLLDQKNLDIHDNIILSQYIVNSKKLISRLENDQFDYNAMLDKSSPPQLQISRFSKPFIIILSLISGLLLSLVIIFLKLLKKN